MKHGLIAVVALLGLVSLASADYLMIKVDLNQVSQKLELPGLTPPTGGTGGEGPGEGGLPGTGGGGGFGLGGRGGEGPGPGEGIGPGAGTTAQVTLAPLWVYACLELKVSPKFHPPGHPWSFVGEVETKWGKRTFVPNQLVAIYSKDVPLASKFQKRKADANRQGKGKDPDRFLELASWALSHGLMKQFHATMEDLKKLNPKHAAVTAYLKTKADIAKKPAEDDPAAALLIKDLQISNYKTTFSDQGHYRLLTNVDPALPQNQPLLKRYKDRLEETYETFFYWFALNDGGKTLPVPSKRLLAVLDADPKKFLDKHGLWGNLPMYGDGFTPRRENAIFLSARRTDEAYTTLEKNNDTHMKSLNISMPELLDGTVWKRGDVMDPMPVVLLQNLVLIQKAMEEEGERTTVSHEGSRQLLAATGLLPRNVETPEWIQSGMASFFDTPYRAFYTSMAAPSWTHLVAFKYFQKVKKLDARKPGEALFNLVSDRMFRKARQSSATADLEKEDNSKLDQAAKEDWEIARASAWAFTYFLARNNKLHHLKRYFEEVSSLPRDLEFDDQALASCFARAFELADAASPGQFDARKLENLAAEWFSYIDTVNLELVDAENEGLKSREPPPPPKVPAMP